MRRNLVVYTSTLTTLALGLTACESPDASQSPEEEECEIEERDAPVGGDPFPPEPPPSIPGSLAEEELPPIFDRITGKDVVPDIIKDEKKAIILGKALFWDMQAGSDGQACASCHFNAGADPRSRNQLSPGLLGGDGKFNKTQSGKVGPNIEVFAKDFPFHELADPDDRDSKVKFDTDDVMSSQGVILATFEAVAPEGLADVCEVEKDPVFRVGKTNVRRVEPRNTPTVINAAFNFRNFWDGRANRLFNGVDPFGRRNKDAFVLEVKGKDVVKRKLELQNSSLASQAVGPILSDFEMSCAGRGFQDVGRKLLSPKRRPLAFQKVDSDDSVLGELASSITGLNTTYAELIEEAFNPKFWDSDDFFDADKKKIKNPNKVAAGEKFTLMETNFSLFWGLAIQAYERTLVADDTPFDKFRDGRDPDALGPGELAGLDVFMKEGKCVNCHATAMFTKASTLHLIPEDEEGGLVERMLMSEEHFHYEAATNSSFTVHPVVQLWKGSKLKGGRSLRFEVEANPKLFGGKLGLGEVTGTVRLSDGDKTCTYAAKKMTLGGDKQKTRDVRIEASLTHGKGCEKHIEVFYVDDAQTGKDEWADLALVEDGDGHPMFFGTADAKRADIRQPALYDNGFYNIGVRPTAEDIGVGGEDPFGNPLSFTEQFVRMLLGKKVPDPFEIDPCRFAAPWIVELDGALFPGGFSDKTTCGGKLPFLTGVPKDNNPNERFIEELRTAVRGAFKTPTLRNVQLTAPYMHNGGMSTLEQVVEFYNRGGDFHENLELDPDITDLGLDDDQRADLVLFLESLTDPNVVFERAPFDHPQLFVPNGVSPVVDVAPKDGAADEDLFTQGLEIPAVGKGGRKDPIPTFLGLEDGDLPPKP